MFTKILNLVSYVIFIENINIDKKIVINWFYDTNNFININIVNKISICIYKYKKWLE